MAVRRIPFGRRGGYPGATLPPQVKGERLLKEYRKMSKHGGARLGLPPRYFRNDPRNEARVYAGQALGRQLQGLDLPVRKVRNRNGSKVVTIPSEICEVMGIDFGDELLFRQTSNPSVMTAIVLKRPNVPANRRRGYDPMVRKVCRQHDRPTSRVVTIPSDFCKLMGIDFGDELMLSLTLKPGVVTIAVIKRPGDSTGSRRGG